MEGINVEHIYDVEASRSGAALLLLLYSINCKRYIVSMLSAKEIIARCKLY